MNHKHHGAKYTIKPWGKYYICDECEKEFESWKRKIINAVFWKWRFYCGRGEAFIADFNALWQLVGGGTMGILGYRAFEGHLSGLWFIPAIWAGQKLLVFFLGYMDYHYWHIFQNEVAMSFQYKPPELEMLERQRNVEKVICEQFGKEYKKGSILDHFIKKDA